MKSLYSISCITAGDAREERHHTAEPAAGVMIGGCRGWPEVVTASHKRQP